jgi:hypothetical protein
LKPVFIIALVAVAMIGVMVPSVFAELYVSEINDYVIIIDDSWIVEKDLKNETMFVHDDSLPVIIYTILSANNFETMSYTPYTTQETTIFRKITNILYSNASSDYDQKYADTVVIDGKTAYQVAATYSMLDNPCSAVMTIVPKDDSAWVLFGLACGDNHTEKISDFQLYSKSFKFDLLEKERQLELEEKQRKEYQVKLEQQQEKEIQEKERQLELEEKQRKEYQVKLEQQQEKEIQEKLSEEQRLTKEINDTKTALDNGEIYREIPPPVYYEYIDELVLTSDTLIEFKDIKLLKNNDYDLLQINYLYQSDEEKPKGVTPFGSMRATAEFSLDYDSWPSYNYLTTDDVPFFGGTMPGSDEWNTECPSYVPKHLNPNIPYTITACYEIPKTVNYFYFENMVFSKSAIISPDNLKSVITQLSPESEEGGGCLIATATYGSEMATEVQQLRELRDNQLLQTESGTAFMGMFNDAYYSFSPIIADYERENPLFKEAVKIAITPMISSLSLMENANSESEVLGIGISVIVLNLGMYLGLPAIVIVAIKKKF